MVDAADDFYSRALERIRWLMLVLGMAALIVGAVVWGWRIGVGFAIGAATSYLNFYWLKKIVAGLGNLTTGGSASGRSVMHKFLLRYFLMAAIAFVILSVSRESLYGLFAGLFLPVAAMLCEAGYEAYVVLGRREPSS